jgi:hypothetical protein
MKPLTEAQVAAFLCAVVPPSRKRKEVEYLSTVDRQAAQKSVATRRAIDEHHEQRRLRREMEL